MYVGGHNSLWFEFGKSNIEFSSAAAPLQPNLFSRLKHPAIDETPGDCCNDLLGFAFLVLFLNSIDSINVPFRV